MLSFAAFVFACVAVFLPGLSAIGCALGAVFIAFFAARKKERFYFPAMLLGAVVMIFVNLQSFGLFPAESRKEVETLYRSIRLSAQAHQLLGDDTEGSRSKLVELLDRALIEAEKVQVETVAVSVPQFAEQFSNYLQGGELLAAGYVESDLEKRLKGAALLDKWALWNHENRELIEEARLQQPSIFSYFFQ